MRIAVLSWPRVVQPRNLRRLYWPYQAVIAGLAILAVWLITLPDDDWIDRANLCIWAVFFADYATRLILAPDRWRFVRQNIPDLIAIIPLDLISGNEEFAL